MTDKESIMSSLRRLALSNMDIDDVDHVLKLEASVKAKGSSLEEVAELNTIFKECDMLPGEAEEMLTLMRGLKEQHLTPAAVVMWKKNDDELTALGFGKLSRAKLLKASEAYGNVYDALTALLEHKSLEEIQQLCNAEDVRLMETHRIRLEDEEIINRNKETIMTIALLNASGWGPTSLQWAPLVLKRADTLQKRAALAKYLNQLEWHDIGDGEMRLVRSDKAAFHDPAAMAKTFTELRSAFREEPHDSDKLLNFSTLLLEKLPGYSIGDYARLLLKSPDLSEYERKVANYLILLEDAAKKSETSDDPTVLQSTINVYKVQKKELETRLEELKKRNPTPEQQEAYEQAAKMATNTIPPGADLREYVKLMTNMMNNLAETAAKDEKLTIDEKEFIAALSKYSGMYITVQHRAEADLKKFKDPEIRARVISRLLEYTQPPDKLIEEITAELEVDYYIVQSLLHYLMTDPISRNELREMGYSNQQLPGWVVIIPGDKFTSPTHSKET